MGSGIRSSFEVERAIGGEDAEELWLFSSLSRHYQYSLVTQVVSVPRLPKLLYIPTIHEARKKGGQINDILLDASSTMMIWFNS